METVREKNFFVRGEVITAALIILLLVTVFGGGIFLFHKISPSSQDQIPSSSTDTNVLSAVSTPAPTIPSQQVPDGPQTTLGPKPTPSKTPSPSVTTAPSPTASVSPSPSPSTDPGPTISLDSPTSDASVSGQLTIKATASDDDLKSVSLYVDDKYQASETSSPFSFTWASTSVNNGPHLLKVEAEDNAGIKKSASVNINVTN